MFLRKETDIMLMKRKKDQDQPMKEKRITPIRSIEETLYRCGVIVFTKNKAEGFIRI